MTIYEALAILDRERDLKRQIDNFINTLKLFASAWSPFSHVRSASQIRQLILIQVLHCK